MISPAFFAAREAEHRNRLLAHLPYPPILCLPILRPARGWRRFWSFLCHPAPHVLCPIVHLTERHRLELTFAGNAFFTGQNPLLGDVQLFLWRLHPAFFRPDGSCPNHQRHDPRGPLDLSHGRRARRQLARRIPHVDLFAAERIIQAYIATTGQDQQTSIPESNHTGYRSPLLPDPNYWDDLLDYAMETWGMTRDEVLDTPRALIFQLHRNRLLHSPDGHLDVFSPSDRLLSAQ